MAHRADIDQRRRSGRTQSFRLTAVIIVILTTAGCGSRLTDPQIQAAAGLVPAMSGADGVGGDADPGLIGGDKATVAGQSPAQGVEPRVADQVPQAGPSGAFGAGAPTAGNNSRTTDTPAAKDASTARATGGMISSPRAGPAQPPGGSSAPVSGSTGAEPGGSTKPPIVLGHIGDYSGLIGTVTKGGNVMAQVVARFINDRGGLDGHPLKIIGGDAGGDPARALSLVRDMVENKGAIAFVGTLMAFSGYGPRDYLEQHKIPVIGGDGTTNVWLQSPMYFTSAASLAAITYGALKHLVELGKRKIAILYCVEAEQCKTWHDTAKTKSSDVGAQIVYEAQVSVAQPDFTAECIQAQRGGAESIMAALDGPSVGRVAGACAQQGYHPQYMTASLAVIESIAKDPNLDGLVAPQGNFPHMADDLPAEQEYHAAIASYAPTLVSSPAVATVWTAGALLREAEKTLPAGRVTSADLFPGLYAIKDNTLDGLVGPLSFAEEGHAHEVRCVFIIQVKGGAWTAPYGSRQQCF